MIPQRLPASLFLALSLAALCAAPASRAVEPAAPRVLRLFAVEEGQKRYFTGYDWLLMDLVAKKALVEKARLGAVRLNAVIALPAETYVRELDRMYGQAEESRQIEVGEAIQGLAISLKDWDDGTDPNKKLQAALHKT